jgi:hypothetical protein
MPTPGAPSASLADKELNSYIDNGDGTYTLRTGTGGAGVTTVQTVAQQPGNRWPTRPAAGTSTNPGAGATIVASAAVSDGSGYYDIQIQWGYGATGETTTVNNFIYTIDGVTQGSLLAPVNATNIQWGAGIHFKAPLNNGDVIRIGTGSAASSGAIYIAAVQVTREA